MFMIGLLFILAIIHVLVSQPLSFLSVSLGGLTLGIPLTLLVLGLGYGMGILIFYVLIIKFESKLNTKRFIKFQKALNWLDRTPLYKHTIALGTPLVPTYAIKVMLVLGKSFKNYALASIFSYVLLTFFNVLLYYGIFVELLMGSYVWLSFIVLCSLIIVLYRLPNKKEE
jgi:hypothetical protein